MAFIDCYDDTGKRFGGWIPDEEIFMPYPVNFPQFSARLKAARKAKKISLSDMAEKIGIDWVQYSKYDNGYEFPDDDTLIKINRVLFGRMED